MTCSEFLKLACQGCCKTPQSRCDGVCVSPCHLCFKRCVHGLQQGDKIFDRHRQHVLLQLVCKAISRGLHPGKDAHGPLPSP